MLAKGTILKGQESNFSQFNRAKVNKEIADTFVKNGTPRKQIFISGHSCGGMGALRMEALFPRTFNAGIAFMPNCWDRSEHSPIREIQLQEIRKAKRIDALIMHSADDGEQDYNSNSTHLKWMDNIAGVKWFELALHSDETGKKIIVNGIDCKLKKKMKGGWEETHDPAKGHRENAFTPVNPERKRAMLKKVQAHETIFSQCFAEYIPEIVRYIKSRL